MRRVGLFEAKQKLSELVEQARTGENIGITRHGKLAALLVPPRQQVDVGQLFEDIEDIRKRVRPHRERAKKYIEEGRS